MYQIIKECRNCNSTSLRHILDLRQQPPANSLHKKKKKINKIPLNLLYCSYCSLVQLAETVDPAYLFRNYLWVTSTSKTANDYSKIFHKNIIKKYKKKIRFILEIASNDGTFLKPFLKTANKVIGVDPAKNIAKISRKNGIETISEFFNKETALNLIKKEGKADVIFARNVIPHVKDIHSIIDGISTLLSETGIVAIEFHYAKIILDQLHYDSIYHEHLFYFTIKTISNIFLRYNLKAFDAFESPISGGSLVIYFSKNCNIPLSKKLEKYIDIEKKNKINAITSWKLFAKKSKKHSKNLKKVILKKILKENKILIGFGASARSSTLLNFSQINDHHIEFIVDKNKLKHNLYTPGSNIIIKNIEILKEFNKSKINIIILAWNFKNEIINFLKKIKFKGKILIPLPKKLKLYDI
jgi:SAM-dependent methyltransferase